MDAQETKQRERQSYDSKTDRRSYGSLWCQESLSKLLEASATPMWENLLKNHAAEGTVLDIGCGGGAHVKKLQSISSGRDVFGIELSRRQLSKSADSIQPYLIQADGEQLPFYSDTFNAVITRASLHHLPNWNGSFINEIKRFLKPGGTFIFWEPGKYNPPAAIRRRFFPSDSHTPDESPFNPNELESELKSEFSVVDLQGHYVISNIIPVISKHSPTNVDPLIDLIVRVENSITFTKQFSWILTGYAKYK